MANENSISVLHDFLQRQLAEQKPWYEAGRDALKAIDVGFPISVKAEQIIGIVDRHNNAVRKLSGTTSPVKDNTDLKYWTEELIYCRAWLERLSASV